MFDSSHFLPHGHCFLWTPAILWSWVVSNGIIAAAYYSIPIALFYFVRKRRDIEFKRIFLLFGAFILLCGTSHLMSIYTLWVPNYGVEVAIDIITAAVSIVTAVLLWPLIPAALKLPSPRNLEEKNQQLQAMNENLEKIVAARVRDSERLAAIVSGSNDAIYSKSLAGEILTWNSGAETIFQYTADELIGKSVFTLVPRDKVVEEESLLKGIGHGGNPEPYETVRLRKDGQEVPVFVSSSPVRNSKGEIVAVSSIVRDITQKMLVDSRLKETTDELTIRNHQLVNVNRAKDEFIATLSHELRSPLNIIIGFSDLLNTLEPHSKDYKSALESIQRSAKTQMHLVEDLLDMSRIISGKFSLSVGTHNLSDIIDDAAKGVEFACNAKSITLSKEINVDVKTIVCDSGRMRQILWNLMMNAVKFTGKGGRISLKVEQANGEMIFQVKDTGRGIDQKDLPHLFDRLWQAEGYKPKEGGLGLGLKISKDLAEAHGGSIEASSEGLGEGATFTVHIPIKAIAIESSAWPDTRAPLKGLNVLVVDDSPDAVQLIKTVLQHAGATVETAFDGSEAIEIIRRNNIQFIVSDINMPIMDGFTFMQETRQVEKKHGKLTPRPAIALTARTGPGDKEKAYAAGFQLHLIKPVQPKVLVEKIVEVLTQKSS